MNVLTEIALNLQALARPAEAAAFLGQALALSLRSQTRMNPDRADIVTALGRRHNQWLPPLGGRSSG